MNRMLIPKGARKATTPGRPFWYLVGDDPDWRYVTVSCPNGHLSTLRHLSRGTGHEIDAQGVVSPSVVCPHDGCDFHEFVQLEGWT